MYVLQSLHGQIFGFYFVTLLLKTCKDEVLFSLPGNKGLILAPKFDTVSVSNNVVLMFLEARKITLLTL